MDGYPKHLNSKADYLYLRENFPKEQWLPCFQALLDERLQWFNSGKINDEGVTDATHKVVEQIDQQDNSVTKYQYVLREHESCKMNQLGFTVEEIQKILGA